MYNPALDAHMTCTTSAVRVWRKYGWVPYDEWLAAQQPVTPTEPTDPTAV